MPREDIVAEQCQDAPYEILSMGLKDNTNWHTYILIWLNASFVTSHEAASSPQRHETTTLMKSTDILWGSTENAPTCMLNAVVMLEGKGQGLNPPNKVEDVVFAQTPEKNEGVSSWK